MKEKLKKLNMRLTELADYLNLSRPTLYKYLEEYEQKKYKDIDKKTKAVFDFIKKKTTFSKIEVIDYIINELNNDKPEEINKLIDAILLDKALVGKLVNDIHDIGIKGVIIKIKSLYIKE